MINENDVSGQFEQRVESFESSEKMTSSNTNNLVFDEGLVHEFQAVPITTRDESEWYGPWDTVLHCMFPNQQGFQISLQRQFANMPKGPEWTVYFLIKYRVRIIVCIVEIKPSCHYDSHKLRIMAYERLKDRLEICLEDGVEEDVSAIYGLSCIGTRFMIMKLDTRTQIIQPQLHEEARVGGLAGVAPKQWWGHRVLTRQGSMHLNRLVDVVKRSLNTKHKLMSCNVVSLPDDSDDEAYIEDEVYMDDKLKYAEA